MPADTDFFETCRHIRRSRHSRLHLAKPRLRRLRLLKHRPLMCAVVFLERFPARLMAPLRCLRCTNTIPQSSVVGGLPRLHAYSLTVGFILLDGPLPRFLRLLMH